MAVSMSPWPSRRHRHRWQTAGQAELRAAGHNPVRRPNALHDRAVGRPAPAHIVHIIKFGANVP